MDTPNKIPESLFIARRLRTLFLPNQGHQGTCKGSNYEVMFLNFRYLRVFDLHSTGIVAELSSINHLKHLRYLDLSNNVGIQVLPHTITNLVNLQVLKLSFCRALKELPKDIEKLLNLRHLYCDGCDKLIQMPSGIGNLTSLQSLSKFAVARDSSTSKNALISHLIGLSRLNRLRGSLEISNLGYVRGGVTEFKAANLKEKQCLQSTVIAKLGASHKLKRIEDCSRCQFLPRLDRIPSLKCLEIRRFDALEYMVSDGNAYDCLNENGGRSTFFPSLKELYLEYCPNLKGWWKKTDEGDTTKASTTARVPHFPCLSTLRINRCPELTWMPLFPSLDDRLSLENATVKLFQLTMEMKVAIPVIASSVIYPLSKLKALEFRRIGDLESLPEEWIPNLTSLQKLYIVKEKCENKKGVDWSSIAHIPNITIDREEGQIEGLGNL
ncbi:hypothetical protein K2173_012387 [Erythroxylum novogranatense]|uniref:Disease resistance R13L4/SHOC-2-like LRR domain-containing protein n=1 Tax=Erythroxylum novogranatense TaxID=1862640 RepID=A0AAV8U9V6_9ROSI|nr:hypothetical protein K2173_012387 [Erythroxylum novogranatense]